MEFEKVMEQFVNRMRTEWGGEHRMLCKMFWELVEVFFITPLFQSFGYLEEDFAFGSTAEIAPKIKNLVKVGGHPIYPDLVLFDGTVRSPKNALVIIEARKPDKEIQRSEKNMNITVQETRLYDSVFPTCLNLVTNGDAIHVYSPNQVSYPEPILWIHRGVLSERWGDLWSTLGKQILLEQMNPKV